MIRIKKSLVMYLVCALVSASSLAGLTVYAAAPTVKLEAFLFQSGNTTTVLTVHSNQSVRLISTSSSAHTIEFYANNALIATASPSSQSNGKAYYEWSSTAAGDYTVFARAIGSDGTTDSSLVSIKVLPRAETLLTQYDFETHLDVEINGENHPDRTTPILANTQGGLADFQVLRNGLDIVSTSEELPLNSRSPLSQKAIYFHSEKSDTAYPQAATLTYKGQNVGMAGTNGTIAKGTSDEPRMISYEADVYLGQNDVEVHPLVLFVGSRQWHTLRFSATGKIQYAFRNTVGDNTYPAESSYTNVGDYTAGSWYRIRIEYNMIPGSANFSIYINDVQVAWNYVATTHGDITAKDLGARMEIRTNNEKTSTFALDNVRFSVFEPTQISTNVAITSPAQNTNLIEGDNLSFTASAVSTGGSVAKVEYWNGQVKIGEVTTAPYNFTWENIPMGTYAVTAKAIDDAGSILATSQPVSIAVNSLATVISFEDHTVVSGTDVAGNVRVDNTWATTKEVMVIVASYYNSKLHEIKLYPVSAAQGSTDQPISMTLPTPDSEIRVFVWNGMTEMKPLPKKTQ